MPKITKEIRNFIKQGMEWSIKKQSELFNKILLLDIYIEKQ